MRNTHDALFQPLELPGVLILQNRIVKSAMSDSLGDGRGNPTDAQMRHYERWANGGVAASRARKKTSMPLMATGGFKTRQQAMDAVSSGSVDIVGIARALVLDPALAQSWRSESAADPEFPRFSSSPAGGIAVWYTLRLTQIAADRETADAPDLEAGVNEYDARDRSRVAMWADRFH